MADATELTGVRRLWDADWWEGPLMGVAEYEARQYWFEAAWDDETDDWAVPRRYILREMSADELEEAWRWHSLYEASVSTEHCHHDNSPAPVIWPQEMATGFYARHGLINRFHYADLPVVGEFDFEEKSW